MTILGEACVSLFCVLTMVGFFHELVVLVYIQSHPLQTDTSSVEGLMRPLVPRRVPQLPSPRPKILTSVIRPHRMHSTSPGAFAMNGTLEFACALGVVLHIRHGCMVEFQGVGGVHASSFQSGCRAQPLLNARLPLGRVEPIRREDNTDRNLFSRLADADGN